MSVCDTASKEDSTTLTMLEKGWRIVDSAVPTSKETVHSLCCFVLP